MHVENITSNAMSLDRNGQSMLIQVYEKEIDRLNNIITKLEKWLLSEQERYRDYLSTRPINDSEYNSKYATQSALLQLDVVLDKLKELKENK